MNVVTRPTAASAFVPLAERKVWIDLPVYLAVRIADLPDGTYNFNGQTVVDANYRSGYIVATQKLTRDYIQCHISGGFTFGVWHDSEDDDRPYLDVVTRVERESTAIALARELGELAIWDVASACEIRVS